MQAGPSMCHFCQPAHEISAMEKSTAEEEMKAARTEASESMGELIAVGQQITPERVQECIQFTVFYYSFPLSC